MIKENDVLTLSDGNRYYVANKMTKDQIAYFYLVDIDTPSNIKFCYEEREDDQINVIVLHDKTIIQELIKDFLNKNKEENWFDKKSVFLYSYEIYEH